MKQENTSPVNPISRIAYLASAFIHDMITETEAIELNRWLEINPDHCDIFNVMTFERSQRHDFAATPAQA